MTGPLSMSEGSSEPLGVTVGEGGANVAVVSTNASRIDFCLFDESGDKELARLPLRRAEGDVHCGFVVGVLPGARFGLRADGPHDPARGHWFDPQKLLVDPYAREIDRPFVLREELSAPRSAAIDTAPFVPKGVVRSAVSHAERRGGTTGWVYELAIRAFTQQHPAVPERLRGTVAGLGHPAVIEYLAALGVDTVEIMPLAAWIDDRHLPPLGLANAWGYNPVVFMAPDPRLAPGGLEEIRATVAALHRAGISVVLDVVYNHTGESDAFGPTLSLRGLDNALYYRHADDGTLINDAGTGNTLATERPAVMRLVVDAMRAWAEATGVDGFRLDLATTLGRTADGFSSDAPIFRAIAADPVLRGLTMIAEPWDVGPGGYQLGRFPPDWREWNDRFRDDVRLFWRGDSSRLGALATRLAGSSDFFAGRRPSASVNFIAAHDGFTLRDLVSYAGKNNEANGEANRDGTDGNFSWNNGIEGETGEAEIIDARNRDVRALLATLFLARGTPMLTAGDEFGRTQRGNNNAYAQDNAITWLDWMSADMELSGFVGALVRLRRTHACFSTDRFLIDDAVDQTGIRNAMWLSPDGREMQPGDWDGSGRAVGLALYEPGDRAVLWLNAGWEPSEGWLPPPRDGFAWQRILDSGEPEAEPAAVGDAVTVPPRAVVVFSEAPG